MTRFVPDATAEVRAANQFNPAPSKGQYAVADVRMTYTSKSGEGDPSFDIKWVLVGGDHLLYSRYECGAVVNNSISDTPDMQPGATVTATLCFNIPPAAAWGAQIYAADQGSLDFDTRLYWG